MTFKKKIFLSLISLIYLAYCIDTMHNTINLSQVSETIVEIPLQVTNNKEFNTSLRMNQILVVKIHGNPSTGYGWYLNNYENLTGLKALNLNQYGSTDNYQTDPHPAGFVGVPGAYYFRFQPSVAGQTVNLDFVNKRPWMPEENVKRVRVIVNIRDQLN